MRVFDCGINPEIFQNVEVRALTPEEAQRKFLAAVLRALTVEAIEAFELEEAA
jgi:hypothetical protein